ncbi:hypothetical protein MSKU9_1640 [Komagataeibacter diospyri]|uniref:Uncharacterized protein n=1 Tax=Komagataeibacter diospyri TaxID=1932662 RepID=A0A4P5NPU1_9PROT|nr:hypothetical protein MSKU9_1640 [Komagataeibacter diospyri]
MADDGGDQNKRGHAQGHTATRFMDLIDDQIVAPFSGASEPVISQPNSYTCQRQEPQQIGMGGAIVGDVIKRPEEDGA